jgi:periplasmic protein TonB
MSSRPLFPPVQAKPSKHRLIIVILLGIVLLGGIISFLLSGGKSSRRATTRQEVITITLPPPPPPPPPPKVEPVKIEPPADVNKAEIAEEAPVDLTPPDEPIEAPPSEDLGTNITGGNGPDMGLTRGGGNGRIGGGRGGLGGKNQFARYSISAKASIEQALRGDAVTRKAIFNDLTVEFWPDSGGTITRARILSASAGSTLDQAVKRVLVGLQTPPAATPAEMPPSVRIRISARKSS